MKKQKRKRKIRLDRVFIFLFVVGLFILGGYLLFNIEIKNIYITNNYYLKDQNIIEQASIENYPKTFKNPTFTIKKRLENNTYIKEAKVTKKWLNQVYIEVLENRPLFYYNHINKTVLLDGTSTDDRFIVPTVLNYIMDSYYKKFIDELTKIDMDILTRISEIEFKPTEVDDNRFLLSMNDGNYVYVNIATFNKLNKYLSILENLPNEKGILYLDYGNNFEIIK